MAMFATIKTFVLVFSYFAAFQLGKMTERPKNLWPRAKAGQNAVMVGDWELYQKIYYGVVGVAILLTLGDGGMMSGSMLGGGMGGY